MTLVRSWRSALLRASGALLLVPIGLLLAVGLAAWLIGVGDFGRVGQLVAGPGLPPASAAEAEAAGGVVPAEEHLAVPPVPVSPTALSRRSGGTVFAPRSTGPAAGERRRGTTRRETRRPGRRTPTGRRPSRRPTGTTPTTPTTTTPGTPTPASQAPGAPRQPTGVVRRIGAQVDRIVRPIPIVGPTTADAVNTVVELIDPPPGGLLGSEPRR